MAYDRVHPEYLEMVLERFGFPQQVIKSILTYFFSTQISLNIDGYISDPISQSRSLRQGNPLPSILFNLAFEPLLAHIQSTSLIQGIVTPQRPEPVKLGAYADDLMTIVASEQEWEAL
jgi:hypothetical protein